MAATVEICNEGPRSVSLHPPNEDHTESDIETVVAYVDCLRPEDTRALQPSYSQTRYHTTTSQLTAITEG